MTRRCSLALILLGFAACATESTDPDLELAESDASGAPADGKADAGWSVAPTFHVGAHRFDLAGANDRRVYPLWADGTSASPVKLDVRALASEGNDVRITVLGPLVNGTRAVLGADGYASKKRDAKLAVALKQRGEYQIVVGSYQLARETFFELSTACTAGCGAAKSDVLASPKAGALVADASRLVKMTLGTVLANRTYDVAVELWASPPAQPWAAKKVATSIASGTQVNAIVPASVKAGDDLQLVVRIPGGRILDAGVPVRFAPERKSFARVDSILYGDIASLEISGVTSFFEGRATLALRSVTRNVEIAQSTSVIDAPGHIGNGYNAFDATFAPDLELPNGSLNPNLPRDGELLSVGAIGGGDGVFRRLACFE